MLVHFFVDLCCKSMGSYQTFKIIILPKLIMVPKVMIEWIAGFFYVLESTKSNLGPETSILTDFHGFSQSPMHMFE